LSATLETILNTLSEKAERSTGSLSQTPFTFINLFHKTMLEYNPIPTNKTQFDSGVQMTRKRKRNKKHKNVFSEIKTLKNGGTKND